MKRIILLIVVFTVQINSAQSIFPINGENVGIGTLNPLYKLDVVGGGHFKVPDDASGLGGLTIETYNGTNLKMGGNSTYSWIQSHMSLPLYINELGNNTIFNIAGGRVGIGTTNPLAKLEVNNGNILVRNVLSNVDNESSIMIAHSINFSNYDTFGTSIRTITQSAGYNTYGMQFFTKESFLVDQTEKVRIQGNGNVGIGTTNPDAKLAVNGTIHSKEVKVDLNFPAPDYVFANDYNLRSLQEVENYIKENSHLPEIPSAKEFEKNGINVSEMNMALLKKVEELTLYMIEMKKENIAIKNQNVSIREENNLMKKNQIALEKRILKVENK